MFVSNWAGPCSQNLKCQKSNFLIQGSKVFWPICAFRNRSRRNSSVEEYSLYILVQKVVSSNTGHAKVLPAANFPLEKAAFQYNWDIYLRYYLKSDRYLGTSNNPRPLPASKLVIEKMWETQNWCPKWLFSWAWAYHSKVTLFVSVGLSLQSDSFRERGPITPLLREHGRITPLLQGIWST